jgi:hypothetical protein
VSAALRLFLAVLLAGLIGAQGAAAYDFEVHEWSVDWLGFADDFQDGVLEDGEPGEAFHYAAVCGAPADEGETGAIEETGGALVLSGPQVPCNGAIVGAAMGAPEPTETRATFALVVPELGASYGISLSTLDQSDLAVLVVTRQAIPQLGLADALLVVLAADPFAGALPTPVRIGLLSSTSPHAQVLDGRVAIELRLTTTRNASGELIPNGQYRRCAASPCEAEATTPFLPMTSTGLAADGGALSPALLHYPAFTAFAGQEGAPFEVAVEEWLARGRGTDDFEDGVFPDAPSYLFTCGDEAFVGESGGVLHLRGPANPACGTSVAFNGGLPGPVSARASFSFEVPRPCEAFGFSIGPDPSQFALDYAYLVVARDEVEVLGPPRTIVPGPIWLRLYGESEAASGGPAYAIAASTLLSTTADPETDPALADVTSIELALDLEPDGDGQRPAPGYRLCTATGCPVDFTPLGPPSFYGILEIVAVCGVPTWEYGFSSNGGRIDSRELLGAALVTVPEPAPGASALAALAALGMRRWGRSFAKLQVSSRTVPVETT